MRPAGDEVMDEDGAGSGTDDGQPDAHASKRARDAGNRSALDVLADQAMHVSQTAGSDGEEGSQKTQIAPSPPPSGSGAAPNWNGKTPMERLVVSAAPAAPPRREQRRCGSERERRMPACMVAGSLLPPRRGPAAAATAAAPAAATLATMASASPHARNCSRMLEAGRRAE